MTVPVRLAAFAAALVAVFGLAFGVGRATGDAGPQPGDGPAGVQPDPGHDRGEHEMVEEEG